MCIPPYMLNKIADHHKKHGEFEQASLQKKSIKEIATIRCQTSIKESDKQRLNKFTLFVPSHETTLKILCIAAVVFFTGVIIYNGTISKYDG